MAEKRTLARPYARAVFELAAKEKNFEQWSKMLALLCHIVEDPRVQKLLRDPTLQPAAMEEFFLGLFEGYIDEPGKNFIKTLAMRKRLPLLPDIKALFEAYREAAEKIITVDCTTAVPLTESQEKQFIEVLNKRFERQVKMSCRVDPKIMGGFYLKAGDTIIDGSVRGQLTKLKEIMGG